MTHPNTPLFSDPGFIDRVRELRQEAVAQDDHEEPLLETTDRQQNEGEEALARLATIATEIAEAANSDPAVEAKKVSFYEERRKSLARKIANNRGQNSLVEATEGWIIIPSSSDTVKKPPGKANLTNSSGLGLVLTTDGELYGYVARKSLKPISKRLTKIKRTDIGRGTFLHKEKTGWYQPPVPESTFLPRYRAEADEGLPTLLKDPNSPDNGFASPYFTPYVIKQCYESLAQFVQANNLLPPQEEEPTEESPTEIEEPEPEEGGTSVPLSSVETISDEEKIDSWLDEGLVTLHTWLGQNDLDHWHNPTGSQNQFMTVFNEVDRARDVTEYVEGDQNWTRATVKKGFSNQGINEIVTISKIGKRFAMINDSSPKKNEGVVKITYEAPASGVVDNVLKMDLFLPESEARAVIDMIRTNPASVREIPERLMTGYLEGADESWEKARPNYTRWRAQDGGRSRMAFRDNFAAFPEDSAIIEF
jgi:hypothetical protein